MKRFCVFLLCVLLSAFLGAQQLNLGTIKGMHMYNDLVAKVIKEAGFDTKITVYDQQPQLMEAYAKGQIDGAFFLAQPLIQQVKGAFMISARLSSSDFCAVTTDSTIKITNPGDLKKYTVGIVKGHPGHTAITRGLTVVEAANEAEQFKMLAEGKFQVAISVVDLIVPMAKASGIASYVTHMPPLLRTPTFLSLSSAHTAKKDAIEAAFKKWIDNGQWEAETAKLKK